MAVITKDLSQVLGLTFENKHEILKPNGDVPLGLSGATMACTVVIHMTSEVDISNPGPYVRILVRQCGYRNRQAKKCLGQVSFIYRLTACQLCNLCL